MGSNGWSVLCDFDGTIALEDVIDSLLERYGQPGWRELEADWLAGRIGSRECMQKQVALLDLGAGELDAYLDELPIDADFPEFVDCARSMNLPVGVVSDGLDYVIRRILRRHGLGDLPIIANRLRHTEQPRRWQLTSPYEIEGCRAATCKCARIAAERSEVVENVLLIGDGASDFCAAHRADYVFAKSKLIEHCRVNAIPHRPIAGFRDAMESLPHLDGLVP